MLIIRDSEGKLGLICHVEFHDRVAVKYQTCLLANVLAKCSRKVAKKVLKMIKRESAQMEIHNFDMFDRIFTLGLL